MVMSEVYSFMPVVILMAFGVLLVGLSLLVGKLIRPFKPSSLKYSPYECGEVPKGSAWASFNMRFYVVGLIFIIFDVESALMFPVASVFKSMNEIGKGGVVLVEILIFIGILVSGIAYCWKKGDLDWVKSFKTPTLPKK